MERRLFYKEAANREETWQAWFVLLPQLLLDAKQINFVLWSAHHGPLHACVHDRMLLLPLETCALVLAVLLLASPLLPQHTATHTHTNKNVSPIDLLTCVQQCTPTYPCLHISPLLLNAAL